MFPISTAEQRQTALVINALARAVESRKLRADLRARVEQARKMESTTSFGGIGSRAASLINPDEMQMRRAMMLEQGATQMEDLPELERLMYYGSSMSPEAYKMASIEHMGGRMGRRLAHQLMETGLGKEAAFPGFGLLGKITRSLRGAPKGVAVPTLNPGMAGALPLKTTVPLPAWVQTVRKAPTPQMPLAGPPAFRTPGLAPTVTMPAASSRVTVPDIGKVAPAVKGGVLPPLRGTPAPAMPAAGAAGRVAAPQAAAPLPTPAPAAGRVAPAAPPAGQVAPPPPTGVPAIAPPPLLGSEAYKGQLTTAAAASKRNADAVKSPLPSSGNISGRVSGPELDVASDINRQMAASLKRSLPSSATPPGVVASPVAKEVVEGSAEASKPLINWKTKALLGAGALGAVGLGGTMLGAGGRVAGGALQGAAPYMGTDPAESFAGPDLGLRHEVGPYGYAM